MSRKIEQTPETSEISEIKISPEKRAEILIMSPGELRDFLKKEQKSVQMHEFLKLAANDYSLTAKLSYWEGWFDRDVQDTFDAMVNEARGHEFVEQSDKDSLPLDLEKRFSEDELSMICSNIFAIQVTHGCPGGCKNCGVGALQGIREHMLFKKLENLFTKYGAMLRKVGPPFHWASDALSYKSQDKRYKDVHELAVKAGYNPHVTTRIADPKQIEGIIRSADGVRLSVHGKNPKEVEKSIENISPLVDVVGKGVSHYKSIDKNYKEPYFWQKKSPRYGIGFSDGVLVTTRGIYNVAKTYLSKRYPQGLIVVPLERIADGNSEEGHIKKGDRLESILSQAVVDGDEYLNLGDNKIRVIMKNRKYDVLFGNNGIVEGVLEINE